MDIQMPLFRSLAAALLLCLAALQPAAARTAPDIETRAAALRAGQYVWQPEQARAGPVEIVMSLKVQRAWVFRSGTLIGVSTISSGKRGKESPIGRFEILEKRKVHRSNRYDDAPMPFMQRLNWYGVALHGGHVPAYPASQGCIRLPMGFAEKLFATTSLGAFVFITEEAPASPAAALTLARAHAADPVPPDRVPRYAAASGSEAQAR
jgi:lipoprotein-anchoring transpeptidase ErfK/SrfK